MTGLIIILTVILLAIIVVQIGKVRALAAKIRGEEEVEHQSNERSAVWMLIFLVGFLVFCVASALYYKNVMLGYGPNEAASAHGGKLDNLFDITLFFTGIVFIITHIALFWFSYKYRAQKGRKAYFFPHNTTLEVVWTAVPLFVMTFLVVKGLIVWNDVMADMNAEDAYIEIEATGYQFAWDLRYPGPDGKIGTKNYKLIKPGINPLGQDWTDRKNIDDILPTEIVLPVDTTVRVRITSKDVLHNFYLPHFRVKMDAVPGLPTYFVFKPIKTTVEYREELRKYPEWNTPSDPDDPESLMRWEDFNYELACAELCGSGHYSMRRLVRIVEREEYEQWIASQSSYYMTNIRGGEDDPFVGELLPIEIQNRSRALKSEFTSALSAEELRTIQLKNVFYETGSSGLKDMSKWELDNLAELLNGNKNVKAELAGHTDNMGDDDMNMQLSVDRALAVYNYLSSKGVDQNQISSQGYGERLPIESNDTEEGRQMNRRTELKILSK